jgi:hypothetical protein
MKVLLLFVARWAEPICDPYRAEVARAAEDLGATVRECEYDDCPELVREYMVFNVPAVAIEGKPESLVVGAFDATGLLARLVSR